MDDPDGSTYYLIAAFCLVLSAFFSGSESALFSADEIKLKTIYRRQKGSNRALDLRRSSKSTLASILLGNTLVNVMFASLVSTVVYGLFKGSRNQADLIATTAATLCILVVGEITPKLLASSNPERIAAWVSGPVWFLSVALRPFVTGLDRLASVFAGLLPRRPSVPVTKDELEEARLLGAVDYGETSGAIRNDEKQMIYGLIEAQDVCASDVMVPRPQVVAIDGAASALEALSLMLERGFSRLPVYSGTIDNTTGILSLKDLVVQGSGWKERLKAVPVSTLAQPAYYVPETKRVPDLLREMRSRGVSMSVVVDEFDGVSGVVTVEDLIEEIVGEIHDEYDRKETNTLQVDQDVWHVPGRMSLVDLEDVTGISVDTEEYDTVAGLVMGYLDRMPEAGDSFVVKCPALKIRVLGVKGPRILKVEIRKTKENDENR